MPNEILDALKGDDQETDPKEQQEPTKETEAKDNGPDPRDIELGQLRDTVSQLTGKIDALTSMVPKREEPSDDFEDDDDEEDPVEKAKKAAVAEYRKERNKDKAIEDKDSWNSKTDKDFAKFGFLDSNSKFYREVNAHYHNANNAYLKSLPNGPYLAATAVKARGLEEGWLKVENKDDAVRDYYAANGGTAGATPRAGGRKPSKELAEGVKYMAAKLGFDEKKTKEIYQKRAK